MFFTKDGDAGERGAIKWLMIAASCLLLLVAACDKDLSPLHNGFPLPFPGKSLLLYKNGSDALSIYQHNSDGRWFVYSFKHDGEPENRKDLWRLQELSYFDDIANKKNDNRRKSGIQRGVIDGAWEYAFRQKNGPYFGNYHGSEGMVSLDIFLDGRKTVPGTWRNGDYQPGKTIRIEERTKLLHPARGSLLADIILQYVWAEGHLDITVHYQWQDSILIDYAYVAMLPLLRGGGLPTLAGFTDSSAVYDISTVGANFPDKPALGLRAWNPESGVSCELRLLNGAAEALNNWRDCRDHFAFIYTRSPVYNKFYITRVSRPTWILPGDEWRVVARYIFR